MVIASSMFALRQFDSQGQMQTLPRVPAMQMLSRIVARDSAKRCSPISST